MSRWGLGAHLSEQVMMTKVPAKNVRLKRAYEKPTAADGTRILVDRLWPRGLKKETAALDLWIKDLAPSTELRKWFGHDPKRWPDFKRKYKVELRQHADLLEDIRKRARHSPVTLVYAARDEAHNEAVIIRDVLLS
ncbi:MAG TPA: DUF488 domain-containing protein [Pseudolabrys sp.]|nr:DUF488 domain-containing protein [Pseudolabrys sp.]